MPLTTWGYTTRPDGSLMISTTKQPGAFVTSRFGLMLNPDGSLYIQSYPGPVAPVGSFKNSAGFTLNSNGGLLTSPARVSIGFPLTDGFYINPSGAVYVSGTKQAGAKLDYRGLTFNPDGGLFAY